MKLYRVKVSGDIYILAKDAESAREHAKDEIAGVEELGLNVGSAAQVTSLDAVETIWRECLPFGDHFDDYTIRELFDRGEIETC